MRLSKTPEERKLEIIETANQLFNEKGFGNTSVADITRSMNVAKGTFYYYFKSKDDVIDAIVDHALEEVLLRAEQLVTKDISAIDKLRKILDGHLNSDDTVIIREGLHKPRNRELHERMNVATIKGLTPIIGLIVHQGIVEGTFSTDYVHDTVGFLLTAVQFYLDELLFSWSSEEMQVKQRSMVAFIEKSLGIKKGTL